MDRLIKDGVYTVRRPGRGPHDDKVTLLIKIQQEGEIAFQLHSMTSAGPRTKRARKPDVRGMTHR